MTKLPDELWSTIWSLKQQILLIVDDATEVEFRLFNDMARLFKLSLIWKR
jgi:hypothetical protein